MMLAALLASALIADLVKAPKQPDLGFVWLAIDLRGANEIKVRPELFRETPRWIRLYGIDVPNASDRGYSGARDDLEVLLGRRSREVYFENEDDNHPVTRNAYCVQYMWTQGKLLEFELVRDGWATVNEEGRKGRYAKYLIGAEAEAKRFHDGMWAIK